MYSVASYAFLALAKVAVLATGVFGDSKVLGEEQRTLQPLPPYDERYAEVGKPVGQSISLKQFGAELSRVSEVVRHQLVLNHNEGLVVDSVQQDSEAERIGLKPHDILVEFNEQYLVLPEQFSLLLDSFFHQTRGAPYKAPEVIFIRAGERRVVTLSGNDPKSLHELKVHESVMRTTDSHGQSMRVSNDIGMQSSHLKKRLPSQTNTTNWNASLEPIVLLREDPDCTIRLTQGNETRLQVYSLNKTCIFDELLISEESLQAVPETIRARVDGMLQVIKAYARADNKNPKKPVVTEAHTARLPVVSQHEKQLLLRR
jgi:hypothetical protein